MSNVQALCFSSYYFLSFQLQQKRISNITVSTDFSQLINAVSALGISTSEPTESGLPPPHELELQHEGILSQRWQSAGVQKKQCFHHTSSQCPCFPLPDELIVLKAWLDHLLAKLGYQFKNLCTTVVNVVQKSLQFAGDDFHFPVLLLTALSPKVIGFASLLTTVAYVTKGKPRTGLTICHVSVLHYCPIFLLVLPI